MVRLEEGGEHAPEQAPAGCALHSPYTGSNAHLKLCYTQLKSAKATAEVTNTCYVTAGGNTSRGSETIITGQSCNHWAKRNQERP